jgi:hypothetical protein
MKAKGARYKLPNSITADCFRDGGLVLHRSETEIEGYPRSKYVNTADGPWLLQETGYPARRIGRESFEQFASRTGKFFSKIVG